MKAKFKRFFSSIGLTKAQLITVALSYFLCFVLFLGVVVIWDPMSKPLNEQTSVVEAASTPTNTSGSWITEDRYSIDWYTNPGSNDGSSASKPYIIDSAEDLAGLSWLVYNNSVNSSDVTTSGDVSYIFESKYFKQTVNIDLSAYYWQPIGIYYTREGETRQNNFSGSYDGGNHTVSGVYTLVGSSSAYSYQGLFGRVSSSSSSYPITIKNIGVTNSYIQGYLYVGGVVGYASGTITNCYNTGSVSGSSQVGGVMGYASGTITNCYNTGSVSGSRSSVGGVAGGASATITNCYNTGTVTSTVTSDAYVGGVVGSASGTITNCYNTGSVRGSGDSVGGVVGRAVVSGNITITNCYNTGSVTGDSRVGGVVGYAYPFSSGTITITNCYNTGSVSGSFIGGVVGYVNPSSGTITITNCYNTGSVSGSSQVGGVVGYAYAARGSIVTITNCYNTGSVNGSSSVGGVVGSASGNITITNCYYGANCSLSVGGIEGTNVSGQAEYSLSLTTDSPKTLSWYTTASNWNSSYSWDFENVWVLDAGRNDGYPSFVIEYWISDPNYYSIEWYTNPGSNNGTASNPYIIDSAEDLAGLSWLVYTKGQEDNPLVSGTDYSGNYIFQGKYFKQTVDIDLSEYYWQPIGIRYTREGETRQNYFSGSYDGGNHTVSGVFTPVGSSIAYSYQGLFGYVCSGSSSYPISLRNIGIVNSHVNGHQYVGGIAGYLADIVRLEAYSTSLISGTNDCVGGIAGFVETYYTDSSGYTNVQIMCVNVGTVSGNSGVGGIVGGIDNAFTIRFSYNIGNVNGSSSVAGIIGVIDNNNMYGDTDQIIKNCENSGKIAGDTNVGGIVGMAGIFEVTISDCYNFNEISGSENIGGIVGNGSMTVMDKCHNEGNITGYDKRIGGIIGFAVSTTIINCYNVGTISGGLLEVLYVGGIAGYTDYFGPIPTIKNCYNSGSVGWSNNYVGGVVGYANSSLIMTNSFNTGVTNGSSNSGGVVGYASSSATITSCYYGGGVTGTQGSYGTYLSNIATLAKTETWYSPFSGNWQTGEDVAWDFFTVWKIDANLNNSYPSFREESEIVEFWTDKVTVTSYGGGNGTQSSPYQISNAQQLALLAKNVNSGTDYSGTYFKQTADINLSGYLWDPIGRDYDRYGVESLNRFAGNYDGAGFKVTGISTSNLLSHQGLFGSATGLITRVNISESNINGYQYVGGVVGMAPGVISITECKNSATIVGVANESYVGGVVGYISALARDINITNCYNTGIVTGSRIVGGVVGETSSGGITITSCHNTGAVRGSSNVGGVVGNVDASGTITGCYNTGSVMGSYYSVGGVVGYASYGFPTNITNCYNTGSVSGSFYYIGGVVGGAGSLTTIESCYNTGSVTGGSEVGGVAGSGRTITNCYNTGSVTGSFDSVGGVVGSVSASSTTGCNISKSANFGDITVTEASGGAGGIIGNITISSSSYPFKLTHCYSEGSITVSGTGATVGGFVGNLNADYSTYSNVKIEFCSVDLDIVVSGGSIASQGAFYGGTNGIKVENSYSLLTKSGTVSKVISDVSTQMDNNFGYMLNFREGKPIPLGIFHILDVATRTGIVNRINAL